MRHLPVSAPLAPAFGPRRPGRSVRARAATSLCTAALCAVALAFSTITGPVLTSLCTLGIFLAGRAITDLVVITHSNGGNVIIGCPGARSKHGHEY